MILLIFILKNEPKPSKRCEKPFFNILDYFNRRRTATYTIFTHNVYKVLNFFQLRPPIKWLYVHLTPY